MSRLIVVSNRVSVTKGRGAAGAQGGLAVAMNGALRARGGIWFGWSGNEVDRFTGQLTMQRADGFTTATIDLEPHDVDEYYNGYANRTLWPLFHYRIDLAEYENEFGMGYERVNERFANSLVPLVEDDDVVWVQDYHFLPLAERLRAQGLKNRIGLFLHIPWPPARLFVSLPFHERLVAAMLHYDVIGFQSVEWLESFLHYCRKELHADVDEDVGIVRHEGRTTVARAFPIGIDHKEFMELGESDAARRAHDRLVGSARNRTVVIGVDRLDYSKGLPERIDAMERLFNQHDDMVNKLLYIQIAPPSREDVRSYQEIRATLEQKTGQFNGAHSDVDLVPIRYVNRGFGRAELFGFYRAAKIGLVTPIRDGMNLVAKEYVAAQDPADPGVLILSRFAGAAEQLTDALLVNPLNHDEVTRAIWTAMNMPLAERKERWEALNAVVRDSDVIGWAADFIEQLSGNSTEALEPAMH
ncbi:trehalose-6-phosphate synthase [Sphingopyxis sp. DHUNG17]|uniref:alpha,alpha-trehalose-phosphate synthase (UDP-forming) n=1 Tax=Sphingopyxis jiangsuensis TaxID=2871171 RepID=UPI00191EFF4C|nr:trehalose-6-phosphate synthase [Sphingopyxis lutea]MBL0767685.1 trehalose-6-phosphate synthase [Sphingopyxis lutea]